MADRFQFDVINLKVEHDAKDRRCFRWRSACGACHDVDYAQLEQMLNARGEDGWQVVAFDSDARFGSNLILQRRVAGPDIKAECAAPAQPTSQVPPTHDFDLAPVVAELKALRAELARQPAPQVVVQPTPVHVASPAVNMETVQPHLEAILAALKQIEVNQPGAARAVEQLAQALLPQAAAPKMEPKFEGRRPRLFNWSWVLGR